MRRLLPLFGFVLPLAPALAAQQYELVRIESVFGGGTTRVRALNESGQVVGSAYSNNRERAFLWEEGQITELLPLPGQTESAAFDINDAGVVAGWSAGGGSSWQAVVWSPPNYAPFFLGTRGGYSTAEAINSAGYTAGTSTPSSGTAHAILGLPGGGVVDLGVLGNWASGFSFAYGINDANDVVGSSPEPGKLPIRIKATLWPAAGGPVDLGTLGGKESTAYDVNDAGVVVGWADAGSRVQVPCYWENGLARELGTLGNSDRGVARAIDSRGRMVGKSGSSLPGQGRACMWVLGLVVDLNDFVPNGTILTLTEALDVNDQGWILGRHQEFGIDQGWVLRPPLGLAPPSPGVAGVVNTMTVRGATPLANVLLVAGTQPGLTAVTGCNNLYATIVLPNVVAVAQADAAGAATLSTTVPAAAAGRTVLLQAIERFGCKVSQRIDHVF